MPLVFAWDIRKAEANRDKHGVAFEEAATVFGDPLSVTISDPLQSNEENRFIIIGRSQAQGTMKACRRSVEVTEMRKEYDFSRGVRGKYARRFTAGSRVVVLDPDVAHVFPDSRSVNSVLRALTLIVRRQRRKAS